MRNILSPVTLALATLGFFLPLLTPARALGSPETTQTQDARFQAVATKALAKAGLLPPETSAPDPAQASCLRFEDKKALASRQAQWQEAIGLMASEDPELVHKWLSGQLKPPEVVWQAPQRQLECMIGQMLQTAAQRDAALRLDLYNPNDQVHWSQAKWAKEFERSATVRARVMRRLVRSHYRDAESQGLIWHKKYTFPSTMRAFDRVSSRASEACGLSVSRAWRPKSSRHQKCWTQVLTTAQRQQEIMVASSAPGISRHHWGTDFDIFGLNHSHFLKDGPLWDEYQWMRDHGAEHGFFQPFVGPQTLGPYTYMEERWHWSYLPLAGALTQYMKAHSQEVQKTLEALWGALETKWFGSAPKAHPELFSFVKDHWHLYSFRIAPIPAPAPAPASIPTP